MCGEFEFTHNLFVTGWDFLPCKKLQRSVTRSFLVVVDHRLGKECDVPCQGDVALDVNERRDEVKAVLSTIH